VADAKRAPPPRAAGPRLRAGGADGILGCIARVATPMPAAPSTEPPVPAPSLRPRSLGSSAVVAGKYVLVRRLGAGGMGVVWVAHNRVLDVHVAIKLIDLEQSPHPKRMADRLLQEARAAARIAHPAICRVFDFGETEAGDPFIVSELLHGETLSAFLQESPRLDSLRAVQMLLPIVDGLAAAHAKGIVHRDIKPDNIFLSRDDVSHLQPKLLDFGIARLVDAEHKITLDGTLLGTPGYMSPEQARGDAEIDVRTDVWGVGVVLYELLTGTPPFAGDNYNALLWAIVHEAPVPVTDLGAGDAELWSILGRALAKDPAARWASMRELGVALAAWLLARGVQEDISGRSLRATWHELAAPGAEGAPRESRVSLATPLVGRLTSAGGPPRPAGGAARARSRWLGAAIAAGLALVAGFSTVLVVSASGILGAGQRATAPPVVASRVAPGAPSRVGDRSRVEPSGLAARAAAPSAAVSAAPSTSAPASASPAPLIRRRASSKPDPRTYDFGF